MRTKTHSMMPVWSRPFQPFYSKQVNADEKVTLMNGLPDEPAGPGENRPSRSTGLMEVFFVRERLALQQMEPEDRAV